MRNPASAPWAGRRCKHSCRCKRESTRREQEQHDEPTAERSERPPADIGHRAAVRLPGELGQLINTFHAETVPSRTSRFTLRLDNADGRLVGGLSAVMAWGWLFIDAVWVHADLRGRGAGRALMAHAEAHAAAQGCHSAWLDTFQALGFYESAGYSVFGTLEDYPGEQARWFLRKRLAASFPTTWPRSGCRSRPTGRSRSGRG